MNIAPGQNKHAHTGSVFENIGRDIGKGIGAVAKAKHQVDEHLVRGAVKGAIGVKHVVDGINHLGPKAAGPGLRHPGKLHDPPRVSGGHGGAVKVTPQLKLPDHHKQPAAAHLVSTHGPIAS
jgi:hypothetical protein